MELDQLRVFRALVEHGSFLQASEALGTSRARLRRKLDKLEEEVQVRLLVRSRDGVEPTRAGSSMLEHAREILDQTSTLAARLREVGSEPTGVLRLGLQPGYAPLLAEMFLRGSFDRFSNLSCEVRVAECPLDLLPEHVDVALAIDGGNPQIACDVIEVWPMRQCLLASEAYLAEHGTPQGLDEVLSQPLLVWRHPAGGPAELSIAGGESRRVVPLLHSSDEQLLRRFAAARMGLAYVPELLPAPPVLPALVPVMESEIGRPLSLGLFVPKVLADVPAVRAFVEIASEAVQVVGQLATHSRG